MICILYNDIQSINRVAGFDIQSDRLASQRLDKYLHTSTKTQHQVKSWFFLDVVVRQGATLAIRFDSIRNKQNKSKRSKMSDVQRNEMNCN